jgi:hypothetical protein
VLKSTYPDQPAYRLIEVPREGSAPVKTEERRMHGRRAADREPPVTRVADARSA